ncbi:hypothetical protein J6Y50_02190 [bacterium]|nr:hypothetical protein [bacterium]
MKKIFLLFVIFMFFGVLTAQEAQNEPAAAQTDEKAAAEEVTEVTEAAPAEAPAAENQETEAQNAPQEEKTEPEAAEKPAEPAPEETKTETPAQPAAPEEPAKEEPAQPEPAAAQSVCEPVQKEEKPSKMFYQPSVGIGIGASIFSLRINNDIDFLLKHTKDGTNVYMGLEIDFRYSPYLDDHSIYEIPIQVNLAVDFPLVHKNISRLALWFSAGIDLAIGYLFYYDYDDDNWDDSKDRDTMFKVMPAWGMGVTMLFKNEVTLKLGFDSFYGKYPDVICAAGYRF